MDPNPRKADGRVRQVIAAGVLLTLAVLAMPAVAAVYKWIDPQGHLHYSDRPPPPEGRLVSVDLTATVHASVNSPPVPSPPSMPAATVVRPGPGTAEQNARLKQAVDADLEGKRSEECKQSTTRYQKYVQSRRLYREGPNKERIYLTDAELETERINARRELEESCGSGESR